MGFLGYPQASARPGFACAAGQADAYGIGRLSACCLLVVTLTVRNQFDVTTRSGSRYVRVGCEFANMSAAKLTVVQRYITRVERERKARLNGFA